jgi:hypothetical protein
MPLAAGLVSGGLALGGAVRSIVKGTRQNKQAKKIDTTRPVMTRTAASKEQEDMARNMAMSTRLPGQAYAENQIGAQTARANNVIQQTGGSTGEIINGLSSVDQNARNATNDLSFQAAQLNQHNKELFSNVLSGVSQDQKDLFDYNVNQPYQTRVLKQQALKDAGSRNIDNGIDRFIDAGSNIATSIGMGRAGRTGGSANRSGYLGMPDYNNTYNQS